MAGEDFLGVIIAIAVLAALFYPKMFGLEPTDESEPPTKNMEKVKWKEGEMRW